MKLGDEISLLIISMLNEVIFYGGEKGEKAKIITADQIKKLNEVIVIEQGR